jgi:uncharacterized lipoprotein YmbA
MKHIKLSFLILSIVILTGCSSSPQRTQHYTFNATSSSLNLGNKQTEHFVIAPLQLASFLDQPGLVIQLNDNQVFTSSYHRWAQPLREILHTTLAQELNRTSSTELTFSKKQPRSRQSAQLHIDVEQFNSNDQSQVVFSGQFSIYNKEEKLISNQSFHITKQLSQDGYPHSVNMLQLTITQLAKQINNTLSRKN